MKIYLLYCLDFLLCFTLCRAQVPVSSEPMHHKILDNGHVRLLDVHIQPGDTTRMHIHATPSVFVVLKPVKTGSQVIQEEDHSGSPVTHFGNIYFEGFYQLPRIHRVWNSDVAEFRVMDIELPNKDMITIDPPIREPGFDFLFEEKPVRAYRLTLSPGMKIVLAPRKAEILVIQLSDGADQVISDKRYFHTKGDFTYIPSGKSIDLLSVGKENAEFAFFELK